MERSDHSFSTESVDLAAFLTVAGHAGKVVYIPGSPRAVVIFEDSHKLHEGIVAYERGASLPAKHLLSTRAFLFRECSRAVREGVK